MSEYRFEVTDSPFVKGVGRFDTFQVKRTSHPTICARLDMPVNVFFLQLRCGKFSHKETL